MYKARKVIIRRSPLHKTHSSFNFYKPPLRFNFLTHKHCSWQKKNLVLFFFPFIQAFEGECKKLKKCYYKINVLFSCSNMLIPKFMNIRNVLQCFHFISKNLRCNLNIGSHSNAVFSKAKSLRLRIMACNLDVSWPNTGSRL